MGYTIARNWNWLNMKYSTIAKNTDTENKGLALENILGIYFYSLLFLPPFFMSWTQSSKTFAMYTKGLFLSNIVHKSV